MPNNGNDVLNSWKAIASYLEVSVRTAQLWELQRGLPVRRTPGGRGLVWADPAELEAWRRSSVVLPHNDKTVKRPSRLGVGLVGLLAAVCLGLYGWLTLISHELRMEDGLSVPLATSPGDEVEPTFSPDGTQVAYIWNGNAGGESRNLYVKPVAGGSPRRLTDGPWWDQFPQWSPDGQWIALGRLEDSVVEILLVSPDGVRQRNVARLDNPAYRGVTGVQWVSWLPDSKSVAILERPSVDHPYTAFRLSLETGERTQLTFPPQGIDGDHAVAFSPDGSQMAFVRYGHGTDADVYVSPLSGGKATRLTHDRIYTSGVSWTPDGRALIYGAQKQSNSWGLWRLDLPGFGAGATSRIPGVQEDASWPAVVAVPDSKALRIAYMSTRLIVNVHRWDCPEGSCREGGEEPMKEPPQTVCPSTRSDLAAQYSPDGSRIAFVSSREGSREIFVCNADGSQPVKITSLRGEHTDSPRWSPDGRRLVFTTSFEGNRDVWIADVDSQDLQRLTHEPSHEGRASWSSDGRWIYFRSDRSGRDQIWKAPVENGAAAVQITTSGAFESFEARDGSRLYFTKERARLGLWSASPAGGDETLVTAEVREGWWSPADEGIYYIADHEIRMYRFSTGQVERVARIPGSMPLRTGFSARRDGRSFLWCETTRNDADIMLLETPGS
jgi:Tol biopolymer transport system component